MESIWYTARCNIEADFHDFDWYANGDPRIYPVSMQACPAVPVSSATISTAYNGNSANYVLPHDAVSETFNPLATKDKYGSAADNVTTYLNKTLPVGSPLASGCAAPIMTGVEKDAICPNPGCFYNGSTCVKAGE